MKILLFYNLLIWTVGLSAQSTDYLKIRDAVKNILCGVNDTSSINSTIRNLTAIDTFMITKNMHLYYEDLGKCYWLLAKADKDNPELNQAIALMYKALYHKPTSTSAFWNLATFYNLYGDCKKSRYYMEQYKLHTKKKHWHEDYEKELLARCTP